MVVSTARNGDTLTGSITRVTPLEQSAQMEIGETFVNRKVPIRESLEARSEGQCRRPYQGAASFYRMSRLHVVAY